MAPKTDLSPREELLRLQKRIFVHNDTFIRSQALVPEKGFERYEKEYKKRVRSYKKVSNQEELIEAILESDLIYVGDYHTNQQSQRTLLRLLKLLTDRGARLAVGLELVLKRYQTHLDAYWEDKISEKIFLERIRFKKHWYFDLWQNFKPIFDFAKFHKIPLFGVEYALGGNASLEKRDRESAKCIASLVQQEPGRKLLIFVGDLHIAPTHLPQSVQTELDKKKIQKKRLILYQNSETIYWELADEGIEDHVEIVRLSDSEFCITNTPPIVWQQSYLNWLEHEEDSIDYADAKHSFAELVRRIAQFLEIPPTQNFEEDLEEVEVFTCGDLSFLKKVSQDESFSPTEIQRIKKQILASESYCIPQKKYVYLANISLNHAAEEAAHYLKHLCSGLEEPRDPVDAFYANALHEALGFFGSKIINHKRKCFHEKEYLGLVSYLTSGKAPRGRKTELEMALLILKARELDKKGVPIRSKRFYRGQNDLFFGVTHGLGYMLGDRLYYALLEERITKEEIRKVFGDPMKEKGEPFNLYKRLLRKIRGVRIPKRV